MDEKQRTEEKPPRGKGKEVGLISADDFSEHQGGFLFIPLCPEKRAARNSEGESGFGHQVQTECNCGKVTLSRQR